MIFPPPPRRYNSFGTVHTSIQKTSAHAESTRFLLFHGCNLGGTILRKSCTEATRSSRVTRERTSRKENGYVKIPRSIHRYSPFDGKLTLPTITFSIRETRRDATLIKINISVFLIAKRSRMNTARATSP